MENASDVPMRNAGFRNLLVLLAVPGDETEFCKDLIAAECARGRPPFVAVLTDGGGADEIALARAHRCFQAASGLGVPGEWFQMLGLRSGTASVAGPRFDVVVKALAMILWRRDCNLVAVPWAEDIRADYAAAHAVGRALAVDGVGMVTYRTTHRA
jgi:LmbE family N-acetylglucosaminyl deacetylase